MSSCPTDYPYFFNKLCYKECGDADLDKKDNTKECKCKRKWRLNGDVIQCIDDSQDCNYNEYLVERTLQCISNISCPYDSPYLFNSKCYKKCEDINNNTITDNVKGNKCKCKYNWYENSDHTITCLNKNEECPNNIFPYKKDINNECVQSCEPLKIFNYICFDKCPLYTKESEANKCGCNPDEGYWHKYTEFNRDKLECGLKDKPNNKTKCHNDTKQCVSDCAEITDVESFEFLETCYSSCPTLTDKGVDGKICVISENNFTEFISNIYPNLPEGGLVIENGNNATMQIYGINKNKNPKVGSIIRTNLAYIDLSGCINKIYENNDMEDDEDIVIVKLDIKTKPKKLIVNPIEYEFVNSKTGKVLDASVCEKNEMVVSYPLTYLLKNKKRILRLLENKDEDDVNQTEIIDKFNRGKALYEIDNSLDSFNFNSTIYSNICYPIEINGKDLILENRIFVSKLFFL